MKKIILIISTFLIIILFLIIFNYPTKPKLLVEDYVEEKVEVARNENMICFTVDRPISRFECELIK